MVCSICFRERSPLFLAMLCRRPATAVSRHPGCIVNVIAIERSCVTVHASYLPSADI